MRRFRCRIGEPPRGGAIVLDREESSHLVRVLRAAPGAEFEAFDGRGGLWLARLEQADAKAARAAAVEQLAAEAAPPPGPVLALALTRTSAFEDAIERAVELGARRFVPLAAERCVARLDPRKAEAKLDRWRKLAREALKQCERLWDMEVGAPIPPAEALDASEDWGAAPVALAERSADSAETLAEVLDSLGAPPLLLVGPEGGWGPGEQELLAARARAAHLGAAVLRSETAALAALATALAHAGRGR